MVCKCAGFDIEVDMEILAVREFHVWECLNHHGVAVVQGIMEQREGMESDPLEGGEILIRRHDAAKQFIGVIRSMEIEREGDFNSFRLVAKSASYKMDGVKRKRAFQNLEMTYGDVIREVLAPYTESSYIDTVTGGMKIPHILIQYNETDWDFLKRFASHFNEALCEDSQSGSIHLLFGFPKQDSEEIKGKLETCMISTLEKQEELVICTHEWHQPGREAAFMGKHCYIKAAMLFMDRGEIHYRLWLARNKEQLFPYQANDLIAGVRIKAYTKEVHRNRIRIRFQIEDPYDVNSPSIAYAGEVNNEDGFYMPDIGDEVDVYFPDAEEKNAVAVSAGRKWDEHKDNPGGSVKYMGNKDQIQLYMDAQTVAIRAGREGAEITMGADGTLKLQAPGSLKLEAEGGLVLGGKDNKVSLYAERRICLNAGKIERAYMTLKESGDIVCKASNGVLYKRHEGAGSSTQNTGAEATMEAHKARNAGLALSGVEFLSQAITGSPDFKASQRIMNRILGKGGEPCEDDSREAQAEGNLIKEQIFQNNERLFNSFSYGENKNG